MSERKTVSHKKSDKVVHDFKIAGVPYRLKTSHDEATVNELVSLVQTKVEEALKLTKNNSFQNAAILAAMNMAEELLLLKKKAYRELSRLEEKAILLIDEIDQANESNQSHAAQNAQSNRQLRPGSTPGWN